MKEFKDKLKDLMYENRISSAEILSKEISKMGESISPNAIRGYLKGIRPKSMYFYECLASFFNVDTDFLYNDSNENRKIENKTIGEKIGLSDKSIKNIEDIKEKDSLNKFIEYHQFPSFIKYLTLYYKINKIITYDLNLILYICDLWEYILDRNKHNKQKDLKEYFDKCDSAINNIVTFTDSTLFFDPSDSKYELFKDKYQNLKNIIFTKKIKGGRMNLNVQSCLEELIDLHDEISSKYKMYSDLIKLKINDILHDFLIPIEKMNFITLGSEDYTRMFGKYIEHINSDIKDDYAFFSKYYKKRNEMTTV